MWPPALCLSLWHASNTILHIRQYSIVFADPGSARGGQAQQAHCLACEHLLPPSRPEQLSHTLAVSGSCLTFSSTRAATGRQLKQSVNVFHSRMLYRRLHSS